MGDDLINQHRSIAIADYASHRKNDAPTRDGLAVRFAVTSRRFANYGLGLHFLEFWLVVTGLDFPAGILVVPLALGAMAMLYAVRAWAHSESLRTDAIAAWGMAAGIFDVAVPVIVFFLQR